MNSLSRAWSIISAKLWSSLADLEELESKVALISPNTKSDLVTVKMEMEREGKVAKQRRRWKYSKRTRIAEDGNLIAETSKKGNSSRRGGGGGGGGLRLRVGLRGWRKAGGRKGGLCSSLFIYKFYLFSEVIGQRSKWRNRKVRKYPWKLEWITSVTVEKKNAICTRATQ